MANSKENESVLTRGAVGVVEGVFAVDLLASGLAAANPVGILLGLGGAYLFGKAAVSQFERL